MMSLFLFALREADDQSFIAKLYLKYKYLIRSEIRKVYTDKNDTDDLVHDVFLKLIRHEDRLHTIEKDKLASYIIKTTHTTVATFLMKKKKEAFVLYLEDLENISDELGALDKVILNIEAMEQYRSIFEAMKPKERLILKLKYDLEYTDEEIAAELGLKERSVHVVVYKARKSFEKLLASQMKREKRFYGENAAFLYEGRTVTEGVEFEHE